MCRNYYCSSLWSLDSVSGEWDEADRDRKKRWLDSSFNLSTVAVAPPPRSCPSWPCSGETQKIFIIFKSKVISQEEGCHDLREVGRAEYIPIAGTLTLPRILLQKLEVKVPGNKFWILFPLINIKIFHQGWCNVGNWGPGTQGKGGCQATKLR